MKCYILLYVINVKKIVISNVQKILQFCNGIMRIIMNLRKIINHEKTILKEKKENICDHDFRETARDSHKTYYECKKCELKVEI